MDARPLLADGSVLLALTSKEELDRLSPERLERYRYEHAISAAHRDDESWTQIGWCQPCDEPVALMLDWRNSDGEYVNFREHLHCPRCGLNNRQRFVAQLARNWGRPPFYLYEQVTPFYTWAREHLPEVIGSEYLGHGVASGTEIDGVRHEDALALSFENGSIGTIVSNDVFEHVPEIDASLAECHRVLRPDGLLLFSIPFFEDRVATRRRAELRDGELVHLAEPDYHGNPVDPQGSLVFYEHGWDMLDRLRAAGFDDARVIAYWSTYHGYLGGGLQMMFAARRGGPLPL